MKIYNKGIIAPVVLAAAAVVGLGLGAHAFASNKVVGAKSVITINTTRSTNTDAYTITVNKNGSGSISTFDRHSTVVPPVATTTKQFADGTFDYKGLKKAINDVPNLSFTSKCFKSASFGVTETLTFKGKTSGDLTCMPDGKKYQNLSTEVVTVINKAKTQ